MFLWVCIFMAPSRSCWFQAKTAETTLVNNICFEIPRAGYNINDGFGGGNHIESNLLFNTCVCFPVVPPPSVILP